MPSPPARPRNVGPKTLAESRELHAADQRTIASLKAQLGPPIPKLPPGAPNPDPSVAPPTPTPPGTPAMSLAGLSPRAFTEIIERTDDKTLIKLLAEETGKLGKHQDAGLIGKLYKEVQKRRKY